MRFTRRKIVLFCATDTSSIILGESMGGLREEVAMVDAAMPIGFLGIGIMGEPMAANLAKSGKPLLVWSRSHTRLETVRAAGALVASSAAEVFERARLVILMLADEAAIDQVLCRGTSAFERNVRDHIIVQMGTVSTDYSHSLESAIKRAGGSYVEAPVSGSRKPAESGQLIGMIAGDEIAVDTVTPLLAPMCRLSVPCGAVPNALRMKVAVNVFLVTMVAGLTEAFHFAERFGLDTRRFAEILDEGPMSSSVSKMKLVKLVGGDFGAQAAIPDVLKNASLMAEAARSGNFASPLVDVCHSLLQETLAAGYDKLDMIAILRAIERRTALQR
jgi:3-hydroxyisobutyrate dehydrogenase